MNDEIGTLGPKEWSGVGKDELRGPKTWNATAKPAKGAPVVSKPDLTIPSDEALAKEKPFPVILNKGYRPMSRHFQIGHHKRDANGDELAEVVYEDPPMIGLDQDEGIELKQAAGTPLLLPLSEAKQLIRKGIAERNDDIAA